MIQWKILVLFTAILSIASCNSNQNSRTVTIASKNYTENIILSHILAELVQAKSDIEVDLKPNMGTTSIVWQAFQSGNVDIYPDYTGTIYQAILKKQDKAGQDETLRIVQEAISNEYQGKVFEPFGFNNTYAIAMLRTRAEQLSITKISDLKNHLDLIAGFDSEFIARDSDGAEPMFAAYGFKPEQPMIQLEIGLRYQAIIEEQADYTDAYSTDAKLKRFDMKILEDDLNFFPPYYAVPVVHQKTLERLPELEEIISQLSGRINDSEMTAMNYDVEENRLEPKEVAFKFLKAKGLIQ